MMEFTIRELIWLGTLIVTVSLSYSKLRSEIRHLEDTKAGRRELDSLSIELRSMLTEISTAIARLEVAIRNNPGNGKKGNI
ncbi:MAG: hypothetical protein P9L92_16615 [Candidatus Electryonea clarkiae]|nr:hypothetical protein [Candidatus Electryonea clarkiae]